MFGMRPSQSERTVTGYKSELGIAAAQAVSAMIAGFALALLIQSKIVKPLGSWIWAAYPQATWIPAAQSRVFCGMLLAIWGATLWIVVSSMWLNISNRNWGPTFQPVNPAIFTGFPVWLARLVGISVAPQVPEPPKQYGLDKPGDTDRVVTLNLVTGQPGKAHNPRPALLESEWERLAVYFNRGGRSVSVSDLEDAGFTRGKTGSARRVNTMLTQWDGLTVKGEKGKPLATEAFWQCVRERRFEEVGK
jgi:hypothetical protein